MRIASRASLLRFASRCAARDPVQHPYGLQSGRGPSWRGRRTYWFSSPIDRLEFLVDTLLPLLMTKGDSAALCVVRRDCRSLFASYEAAVGTFHTWRTAHMLAPNVVSWWGVYRDFHQADVESGSVGFRSEPEARSTRSADNPRLVAQQDGATREPLDGPPPIMERRQRVASEAANSSERSNRRVRARVSRAH
jgi:hypothetical protein